MKKFSKILSVALLVALVLSLGVANAFAASIEIDHDASYQGATGTTQRVYSAYKVFDAAYTSLTGTNEDSEGVSDDVNDFTYTPANAAVSYTMATDSPWVAELWNTASNQAVSGQTWVTLALSADGSKYIVTPTATFTDATAKAFGDFLAENIPSTATATDVTVDAAATTVAAGYYLIVGKDTKDAVTRVALVTTDVKMVEKNTYITTGKTTSQESYNVGDDVTYTATVFIPSDTALTVEKTGGGYEEGHGPIILHDQMAEELTFQKDVAATVTGSTDPFTGFTTSYATGAAALSDDCTFELYIPVTSALLGQTITFTYTAKVNTKAVDDKGFVNKLGGELNGYKTNPVDVYVYTFDFDLDKEFTGHEGNAGENFVAKFELRSSTEAGATVYEFIKDATGYVVADAEAKAATGYNATEAKVITVNGKDVVNVRGLKAGTYYLYETDTATGYNKLTVPVEVKIVDKTTDVKNPTHEVQYKLLGATGDATTGTVTVVNDNGTVLPSTGGIGTTIFYVVGGVLVLAAIILLVTKKRMSE